MRRSLRQPLPSKCLGEPRQPIFTVVAGPSGAGKSTLYDRIIQGGIDLGPFIDPDEIGRSISASEDSNAAVTSTRAGRMAIDQINSFIEQKISFSRETTLSSQEALKTIKKAKRAGFLVVLIYVGLEDRELSIDRVSNRVAKGGYDIPIEALLRRFDKSLANAAVALTLCEVAYFYDNSTVQGYDLVASIKSGVVEFEASSPPQWYRRILNGED